MKNLRPTKATGRVAFREVFGGQLVEDVRDALTNALGNAARDNRRLVAADLIPELEKLEFRGDPQMIAPDFMPRLLKQVETALGSHYPLVQAYLSGSATSWINKNVLFLARPTPFL